MDEAEQDQHEARLKELFDSFDTTGTGSLGQEELTDLCHMLQLEEVAPSLQQALLQDIPHGRVHFDQFKEALILVLSNTLSNEESFQEPDCSPEVQPKYIKDGKRYGRRSVPELQDSLEEFDEVTVIEPDDEVSRSSQVSSRNCDELWKSEEREEYEAEGQLRFWNPDDLNASQNALSPTQDWVEEKLQLVCEDLGITRDGHLNQKKLISICEQYGFQNLEKEALEDAFQNLDQEETMSLQDFFYQVCKMVKPLAPSASTPYRQLKRHLSMQSYDESGRRTITPLAMSGTIGFCLLSKLDDGTGYGSVEDIIDLWQEEGIENSQAILKTLDFNLEGKVNLTELTMTLENELLTTKNEVYQAALVSFRSEIRHLLERAEQASREKEKLRTDLEKNERSKSLMASEVDDLHAAIEHRNEYNLRKLDEEYKERVAALKCEQRKEREQILQQANKQRLGLEQELDKMRLEENFLRDRLTLTLKESSRLEAELLETSEKLLESERQGSKLERNLDNLLREKFGDLDPSCAEFFRQEERLMHVRNEHERQRRELQDRIDELQSELEEYRAQGIRGFRSSLKSSLFDEIDSKNAVETDQGIGTEDCPPLNMSIEAEMAIEQMREQHQREVERLTMELESNTTHFEEHLKELKCLHEKEQDVSKQHFEEKIEQIEEKVQHLRTQHAALEAEMVTLNQELERKECEHLNVLENMKATFSSEKAQLLEQEAALHCQLEDTKQTYFKEKEELVHKAVQLEEEHRATLAQIKQKFEEEKNQLEKTFHDHVAELAARQEAEKEELREDLLEKHQYELLEERKKMETQYYRRISEKEAQFAKDYDIAMKKHEEVLASLESRFQDNLCELTERHHQEKSQWELEKQEIVQEHTKMLEKQASHEKNSQNALCDLNDCHIAEKSLWECEKGEMLKVQKRYEEDFAALERETLNRLTELTDHHTREKSQWEYEKEEILKTKIMYEEELASLKIDFHNHFQQLTDRHSAEKSQWEEIIQGEKNKHNEELANLERDLQSKLSDLSHRYSEERSRWDLGKEEFVQEELKRHKEELEVCEAGFQNNLQQLADLHTKEKSQRELEKQELIQVEKNHEAELASLDKSFQDRLCELTYQFESEKLKIIEDEKATFSEELASLERTFQNKLSELTNLHNKEKSQWESEKEISLAQIKKLEEALASLEREFQNSLCKLKDQHIEAKSQWEFVKEEILQENLETQDRLKEKSVSCTALLQEKELLEKSYKEQLNNLMAEKERVQTELDSLRVSSKREENVLSSKIVQLENDLLEELKERDEQICEAEKNVQVLRVTVEKMDMEHKQEKEQLNEKLSQSELCYKEACDRAEQKKEEMFVEISKLQTTICELENEIKSLSKIQKDYTLLEKEMSDLQNVVSRLRSNTVNVEQETDVLRSLQNVHERTVKENVRLVSEISQLQRKLGSIENNVRKGTEKLVESESEQNLTMEICAKEPGVYREDGDMIDEQHKPLDINVRLHHKIKELEDTTAILYKLEKTFEVTKAENSYLQNEVLDLQEKINQLTSDYELVKQAVGLEECITPELEEAHISIPALKMLMAVAKKENLHLHENLKVMKLKHEEAVANNRELSKDVSWLQAELQSMEEMAQASLKLENMYETTKREKNELKMLVSKLQERINELEEKAFSTNDAIQAMGLMTGLESYSTKTGELSPRAIPYQDLFQNCNLENSYLQVNVKEAQSACVSLAQQKDELSEDTLTKQKQVEPLENDEKSTVLFAKPVHPEIFVEDFADEGKPQEMSPRQRCLHTQNAQVVQWDLQNKYSEMQKRAELLSCEAKMLKEENEAFKTDMTALENENEICHQKIKELQETCEEMWVNLETVKKEKVAVQRMADSLIKQVSELKSRNQQLDSENAELCIKNTQNQADVQDLNRRLVAFLKQKERKDTVKGKEEWQRERCRLKEEIGSYKSKMSDLDKEFSNFKVHSRFLEQENTLLKQEIEAKQLSKCSEITDLKNEISGLINKHEKLLKEKEALGEELNRCVEKSAKVGYLDNKIAAMKQDQKTWEQQSQTLKKQLAVSQEKIQGLEENLQSVNLQMSRIKSDLRVAQQEKEALKQEVMSLHKQLQNANAKNQVLEMAVHSSGLQNQQKKLYWDDLAQLVEQEQHLLRQENERLQKEVQNTKSDLAQSREKIRQLDSTVLSLKHQKHQSQSSMVKALEQEKSSLRRECDQLQKELISANRKISQMSSLERDLETIKMENDGLRTKQGKLEDQLMEMLHSASSVSLSHSPLQQQACATVPREQYLQLQQQLQQADRRNQQLQTTMDNRSSDTNSPQTDQEQLLRKMEARMMDVEQKLRIVKKLLKEKVNQLKEQSMKNTKADTIIKDLYVENSQLLKALEMTEQRHQTAEKKNYLLEEKIAGLSKIVRDLAPSALPTGFTPQRRS